MNKNNEKNINNKYTTHNDCSGKDNYQKSNDIIQQWIEQSDIDHIICDEGEGCLYTKGDIIAYYFSYDPLCLHSIILHKYNNPSRGEICIGYINKE